MPERTLVTLEIILPVLLDRLPKPALLIADNTPCTCT